MARQNRWAQFGNAFNAVYNAGTQLQSAFASGKIAMKDYEDEEGNKLTGLALDRAKMDDYAAIEQRYGDPMEALRMRTGVETLGQSRLKTDYDTDTYDERVFQGGAGASAKLRADTALTSSAAGLNVANAGRVNELTKGLGLENTFTAGTLDSRVKRGNAQNTFDTVKANQGAIAANDASYVANLIEKQKADAAESRANVTRFDSEEYAASLTATDKQTTAEATLARNVANLQNSVTTNPIYQDNFVGAELAKSGRVRTMEEVNLAIAQNPNTLALAEQNLSNTLKTAETAALNLQTKFDLANNAEFQAYNYAAGLSQAERGDVEGKEAVLLAQQSYAVNQFIREWGKTANPDDPTSMRNLVKGIAKINPIMGQKLSQEYGEHELWEITNRGLRMRAEVNEALAAKGAAGAKEVLDKYNGAQLGVDIVTNDDGSVSMVETRNVGPGGKEKEVARTIATGADEQSFIKDLNAAMDPASLMEYSASLIDMDYKRAATMLAEAQAGELKKGKPLSAQDTAFQIMMNPDASNEKKNLAMAFLFRDNPDLAATLIKQNKLSSLIKGAEGDDDGVGLNGNGGNLRGRIDTSAPTTQEEVQEAEEVIAAIQAVLPSERGPLLNEHKQLLNKVAPEFREMENNKITAAEEMLENNILTAEELEDFFKQQQTLANEENRGPTRGGRRPFVSSKQRRAKEVTAALGTIEGRLEVLQIVISQQKGLAAKAGKKRGSRAGGDQSAKANKRVQSLVEMQNKLLEQLKELER